MTQPHPIRTRRALPTPPGSTRRPTLAGGVLPGAGSRIGRFELQARGRHP